MRETIFALSSGIGKSAVAVVRMSGPLVLNVLQTLLGFIPEPRVATLRAIKDPTSSDILDYGLILYFPEPHSFTGEPIAEFQVHGSRAVIQSLFDAFKHLNCRPAEPGEFSLRAFKNNKLTLTEIEGLADLIDAETSQQRKLALSLVKGALNQTVISWRNDLVGLMARVEALIDFPDEDGVLDKDLDHVIQGIDLLSADILRALQAGKTGKKLRDGFTIALAGAPNAGKSSLFNALASDNVAMVSPIAGTTRDVLEVTLDWEGLPIILFDTAGLHETNDPLELEGIRRATHKISQADMVLHLVAPENMSDSLPALSGANCVLRVLTKVDLLKDIPNESLAVSARTGEGLRNLIVRIVTLLRDSDTSRDPIIINRQRHITALELAHQSLFSILDGQTKEIEIIAEHMRQCAFHLNVLIGLVGVEDVLDDLFQHFCIGK